MKQIYLDNGATTKIDSKVAETMQTYLTEIYGNPSSLHNFGDKAKHALEDARKTIATSLNAQPEEIIFTSGGTESDNLAIKGIAYKNKSGHIITSKIEHPAVLNTCKQLEREGFETTYLNVDKDGIIDLKQLRSAIKPNTILISIMHANNEIGTIQPVEEIYKLAKQNKIPFHTDAVQSYTKTKLTADMADMISISSHKIHGPKGIGALYINKTIHLKPLIQGGSHEHKIRPGTENIPGILGFAKATQLKNQSTTIQELRDYLIKELLKMPNTKLNGHKTKRLPNNVNISFSFVEGESLLFTLNDAGIAVSTGSACSSKSLDPSHVLMALGLKHEQAHGAIRFTLSKYNTKEEIEFTINEVKKAVKKLRSYSPVKGDEQ